MASVQPFSCFEMLSLRVIKFEISDLKFEISDVGCSMLDVGSWRAGDGCEAIRSRTEVWKPSEIRICEQGVRTSNTHYL